MFFSKKNTFFFKKNKAKENDLHHYSWHTLLYLNGYRYIVQL